MQNEIELKIMLLPKNIPFFLDWISKQNIIKQNKHYLTNTYYDTAEHYFAQHQMGFRVRSKDQQYEMTLKMAGDIVGGLHIRPEYNLTLENSQPDLAKLAYHYQLNIDPSLFNQPLLPTFSTDFEREIWLLNFQQSQIEIALDQGVIKNQYGEESICEIEFELKQGNLQDLFDLLNQFPKQNGMWLSSLSKAQRGYFIGNKTKIEQEITSLLKQNPTKFDQIKQYQFIQQLADFIRLTKHQGLVYLYQKLTQTELNSLDYLSSSDYLSENLNIMENFY